MTTFPETTIQMRSGKREEVIPEPRIATTAINDARFIKDLDRLKDLRSFLVQEAITPKESAALSLGDLNLLQRDVVNGRAPTLKEWSELETRTQTLFGLLSDPQRRRFLVGEIPQWVSKLPIWLAVAAILALIAAILVLAPWQARWLQSINTCTRILPFYLIWLMSLGAIGSIAFIGMNALSVQHDVTFDLGNRTLLLLRIALGALFGLVLTLPFGFTGFADFVYDIDIYNPENGIPARLTSNLLSRATLLLLPFILGFSTSLVIVILNKLMDGAQALFGGSGKGEGKEPSTVSPSASTSTR